VQYLYVPGRAAPAGCSTPHRRSTCINRCPAPTKNGAGSECSYSIMRCCFVQCLNMKCVVLILTLSRRVPRATLLLSCVRSYRIEQMFAGSVPFGIVSQRANSRLMSSSSSWISSSLSLSQRTYVIGYVPSCLCGHGLTAIELIQKD